jgi:osmoprotectant transport system permease protein
LVTDDTARRDSAPPRIDRVGLLLGIFCLVALWMPFALLRPNRILAGQPKPLTDALPPSLALLLGGLVVFAVLVSVLRARASLRLGAICTALLALLLSIGQAAEFLTPAGNSYARIAPASGFWLLLAALLLLLTDALTRLKLTPLKRVLLLAVGFSAVLLLLLSGYLDGLSLMREYAARAPSFWREALRHVQLALGSLAAAALIGIPFGILCARSVALRRPVLTLLNMVQTIPSIALFGLLIGPLSFIAAAVPGAANLGIAGIGAAPAFVALFLYSLLPMVANTVSGLEAVPREAREAATGMGMTPGQRLRKVELPLALPVVLAGIRIVLVQNIGLATIAALIGGGGFGLFVFQGLGQNAADLILLGALPTVALAFAAAVILDAAVELTSLPGGKGAVS